ncbi:hypothetical protein MSAN_01502100 [Mycena sanguinolenta]|uniref:Uncharacterized protein n=1 Tax=Mycena sanguinolenta TaxID=230812 RepID=A0A8H6Y6M4_9AGAR|nr:hypothetical protein MSAN_01502100 [Mycena sanguinolenta]
MADEERVPDTERAHSGHGSSSPSNDNNCSPPPALGKDRRVVDFDVEDSDWEDVPDGALPGLGTTTHRSHNPQLPANPRRKHHRRVVAGRNVRATESKRRQERANRMEALAEDLDVWEAEREERVRELAEKHGMKPNEVRRRMLTLSTYGQRRKVSLYNAKVSRIMARLNADRAVGECYTMLEVKRMVAEDPSMLEGFMEEEKKDMIARVVAKRKGKVWGTRANNLSAAVDAKRTMDQLMVEITNLAERVGMIGFAMFSRGHVHDKTLPVTIQSWGAMDFFREVLKKDPADISTLFELWAVSRERGKPKKNKLLCMQQECTGIINTGLQTVLGITKVKMNYNNYIPKIVKARNVGLVNWPDEVEFKRMSKQSAVGPLQILLDSLKCGTTQWKVLTVAERKKLIEQYEEMVANGEVEVPEKKSKRTTKERKAKRVPVLVDEDDEEDESEEGQDSEEDDEPVVRKTKPAAKLRRGANSVGEEEEEPRQRKTKPSAARKSSTRDEDEDDDERCPRTAAAKSRQSRRSARDESGDDDEPRARKPAAKPKPSRKSSARDESVDDDEPRPRRSAAKPSHMSSARNEDDEEEEEPRPPKAQPTTAPKPSAHNEGDGQPRLRKTKSTTRSKADAMQNRLRELVQGGKQVNNIERKVVRGGKESGTKRKRAEREAGDEEDRGKRKRGRDDSRGKRKRVVEDEGDRGRKKKRMEKSDAPVERDDPPPERPQPKPLYRGKRTTTAAPVLSRKRVLSRSTSPDTPADEHSNERAPVRSASPDTPTEHVPSQSTSP